MGDVVRVDAAVTHAAFCAEAQCLFAPGGPDSLIVTDSVLLNESFECHSGKSLHVLSIAPLIAKAIRRLELGESVSPLCGL